MVARDHPGLVIGREAEIQLAEDLLADAASGLRCLVFEGEPGIGKTTVWAEGLHRASGHRVLSTQASPSETQLSFAGLTDLLSDVPNEVFDALPAPQREALAVALLRSNAEGTADPRAVSMGTLTVLRMLAADGPVFLAIDDVQWLDAASAGALAFALRRLADDPVRLLAAVRIEGTAADPLGLKRLPVESVRDHRIGPLTVAATHELLKSRLGQAPLRPALLRIHRASGGNPFFALELGRAMAEHERTGPSQPLAIPATLRDAVAGRLSRLPKQVRRVLLIAALAANPTVGLLADAAADDGVDEAVDRAQRAGVVVMEGDHLRFTHPLLAEQTAAQATATERRAAHRALANAAPDLEERARHLAESTTGPDASIAAVLEEAGIEAHRRGGFDAAADLAEMAREMTPAGDHEAWVRRSMLAGEFRFQAFAPEVAMRLLEEAAERAPEGPVRAEALHSLAKVYRYSGRYVESIELLRSAMAQPGLGPGLRSSIEFARAMDLSGRGEFGQASAHAKNAVRLAEESNDARLTAAASLHLMLYQLNEGVEPSGNLVELVTPLLNAPDDWSEGYVTMESRPRHLAAYVLKALDDLDGARAAWQNEYDRMKERGAEPDLPILLAFYAEVECWAGRIQEAAALAEEGYRTAVLSEAEMGVGFALWARGLVAAYRGDLDQARRDAAAAFEKVDLPQLQFYSQELAGFVELSAGDMEAAVERLMPLWGMVQVMGFRDPGWFPIVPPLAEALVAVGRVDEADDILVAFEREAARVGRKKPLATAARSRGLIQASRGDVAEAEATLHEALKHHEGLGMPFELGRTLLVLGQIQRRRKERRAARETLERALAIFEQVENPVWADKARAEMARLGVRRAPQDLTPTEEQVARLIAQGLSNQEVAERLFISRRTVDANLARAKDKLGVRSRAELGAKLAAVTEGEPRQT